MWRNMTENYFRVPVKFVYIRTFINIFWKKDIHSVRSRKIQRWQPFSVACRRWFGRKQHLERVFGLKLLFCYAFLFALILCFSSTLLWFDDIVVHKHFFVLIWSIPSFIKCPLVFFQITNRVIKSSNKARFTLPWKLSQTKYSWY